MYYEKQYVVVFWIGSGILKTICGHFEKRFVLFGYEIIEQTFCTQDLLRNSSLGETWEFLVEWNYSILFSSLWNGT